MSMSLAEQVIQKLDEGLLLKVLQMARGILGNNVADGLENDSGAVVDFKKNRIVVVRKDQVDVYSGPEIQKYTTTDFLDGRLVKVKKLVDALGTATGLRPKWTGDAKSLTTKDLSAQLT